MDSFDKVVISMLYSDEDTFYLDILQRCKRIETKDVPIAEVRYHTEKQHYDKDICLFINKERFDELPLDQQVVLLQQEICDLVYPYLQRHTLPDCMKPDDKTYGRHIHALNVLEKYAEIKVQLLKRPIDSLYYTAKRLATYLLNNELNPTYIANIKAFVKDVKAEVRMTFLKQLSMPIVFELAKDNELIELVANTLREAGR